MIDNAARKLEVKLFLGPPGSGKSYASKYLANEQATAEGRIIVAHDPMGEWYGRADYTYPTVWYWGPLLNSPNPVENFAAGSCHVIDEADMVLPKAAGQWTAARDLLNYGRHRKLLVYLACRRPAALHNDALAFATEVWCFKSSLPRDLKVYEEWFGFSREQILALPEYHALVWPSGEVRKV